MKNDQKNWAILLTPPGAVAIAVVRMAGAGVREFFANHFSREVKPGRSNDHFVEVVDGLKEGEEVQLFVPTEGSAGAKK